MSRKATLAVVAVIGLSALAASGQIFAADPDAPPRSTAAFGLMNAADVPEGMGSYSSRHLESLTEPD